MRHPSNRGERKLATDKFRRIAADEERYDNGHKERELPESERKVVEHDASVTR
jgi:hypothetical protein